MNRRYGGCFPLFCALLGMWILGPAGAAIGFFLSFFLNRSNQRKEIDDTLLYHISALFAAVMKSDRKIMQSELYSYRDFFLQRFGQTAAVKAIATSERIAKTTHRKILKTGRTRNIAPKD